MWNPFDLEIVRERQTVTEHVTPPSHPPTYKAQAKRELARRLVLEQRVGELEAVKSCAINLLEALEGLQTGDEWLETYRRALESALRV